MGIPLSRSKQAARAVLLLLMVVLVPVLWLRVVLPGKPQRHVSLRHMPTMAHNGTGPSERVGAVGSTWHEPSWKATGTNTTAAGATSTVPPARPPPPLHDHRPSCLFKGESDGSAECIQRQSAAAGLSSEVDCTRFVNTRKFDPRCHADGPLWPVLISGAGGAGTTLIQKALRKAGIKVGHEFVEDLGAASWIHAVNDAVVGDLYPFPRYGSHAPTRLNEEHAFRFKTVVHQVRCPSANIAALTTHNQYSRRFMANAAGIDPYQPSCLWGAHVWLQWNQHLETYADARIRVEDYPDPQDLAREVCRLAKLTCTDADSPAGGSGWLSSLGGSEREHMLHHRTHGDCPFEELQQADPQLAAQIAKLSRKYGYDSPDCR